jgi:hypothetical protein
VADEGWKNSRDGKKRWKKKGKEKGMKEERKLLQVLRF